jgi:hypothetical protein
LAITSDSAWVTTSQLWPLLSSAVDMTAKPWLSAYSALSPSGSADSGIGRPSRSAGL